uniref:Uncharacterized protein n=1 Tax=Rhizophora mucronata TaxID=61149 RepID=A0A2P2MMD8_RHIMU
MARMFAALHIFLTCLSERLSCHALR